MVPTGHNQLQNALRNRNDIATNAIRRNIPAGCNAGTWCDRVRYRRFIKPAIGSQPSTPAGRCKEVGATPRLKLTNPEVEDAADPEVQQKEPRLEAAAHDLRAVAIGAADKFLGRFGRRFRPRLTPRRKRN